MGEEFERILEAYGLGDLVSAHRTRFGYINESWIVQSARGRVFVKRRHPQLCQPHILRAQHDLINWLQRRGFPAPLILNTVAGDSFLILDEKVYEAHAFIDGGPYVQGSLAHMQEAALTLGHYHQLVQSFEAPPALIRGSLYSPRYLDGVLTRITATREPNRNGEIGEMFQSLWSHARELSHCFDEHGSLPPLLIHGDYYAENLLFKDDAVVGLVDYDKVRLQPRVVELAEALIYFSSPRPGSLQRIVYSGVLLWDLMAFFLESYSRGVILTEDEIRALPDFIRCIWLQVSLQRLLEPERPAELGEAVLDVLTLARWARQEKQQIIDLARSAVETGRCADD